MDEAEHGTRISLAEVVERYKAEPGAAANAYALYRKRAHESGTVWIGPGHIPAAKVGNQWTVRLSDLEAALTGHREYRAHIARVTDDYEAHILHEGDQTMTWGGYRNGGDFHFVWNNLEVYRHRSDGSWRCNTCFKPAGREHDKPECHTCSDWGSCGGDCTLSAIVCNDCGIRREM